MSRASTIHKRSYSRIFQADRRARLRAAGLCQWCGARPAKPSMRSTDGIGCRCEECARKAAKAARENLQRHRPAWSALGICTVCGCREAMPRESRCGFCAEKQDVCKARKKAAA